MQYLCEHKIRVPEEILVAGQGDSEMSRVTAPPLLTVHYSYEKSGETAVRMLLEALEQKHPTCEELRLGYYIVDAGDGQSVQ